MFLVWKTIEIEVWQNSHKDSGNVKWNDFLKCFSIENIFFKTNTLKSFKNI